MLIPALDEVTPPEECFHGEVIVALSKTGARSKRVVDLLLDLAQDEKRPMWLRNCTALNLSNVRIDLPRVRKTLQDLRTKTVDDEFKSTLDFALKRIDGEK